MQGMSRAEKEKRLCIRLFIAVKQAHQKTALLYQNPQCHY